MSSKTLLGKAFAEKTTGAFTENGIKEMSTGNTASTKKTIYVREVLLKDYSISPKEKAKRFGFESLLDGELLMVSLDLKDKELLQNHSPVELFALPIDELESKIGKAKAIKLHAGLELAKRILDKGLGIQPVIACPADSIPFLSEIRDKNKEHFLCLYLNARNQVIHSETISIGSLSASIVHPREVFRAAITHSAAGIVLAHNHPSGDVSPSRDDIDLTRRLVRAGEIMGIDILDHIIIGQDEFLSMKERGLM